MCSTSGFNSKVCVTSSKFSACLWLGGGTCCMYGNGDTWWKAGKAGTVMVAWLRDEIVTYILARPGGTEELLNWPRYRVVVVYLSRTHCFRLETSLTLRKMSCALASGPQQTEWLEQRKKWSSSPKSCAWSWRSNSGRLHLTGSAESQPESSSKGTWMRAMHPLLPKIFCCIFIRKVSKNFSWCVLNGSYLLTL